MRCFVLLVFAVAVCGCISPDQSAEDRTVPSRTVYRSPLNVAYSPDGSLVAAGDHTAQQLVILDPVAGSIAGRVSLEGRPVGVAWAPDSGSVYVSECQSASVAQVDRKGRLLRRLSVAARPTGLAVVPGRGLLLVADSVRNEVAIVNIADGEVRTRVPVRRHPQYISVTPDEKLAVVGNRFPAGDASNEKTTSEVSLICLESGRAVKHIRLSPNGVNLLGTAVSVDGKWAYIAHNLGRTTLPTEQVIDGMINANAVSIIDISKRKRYATIIVDQPWEGGTNPWGLARSSDGKWLWLSFSGLHRLGALNLTTLHAWLGDVIPVVEGREDPGDMDLHDGADGSAFGRVELVFDKAPKVLGEGIYLNNCLDYVEMLGHGPRGIAVSPDGRHLAAAVYFQGCVAVVDTSKQKLLKNVPLGKQPPETSARRGERIFHDATKCFEAWLSCATCHPAGRADGLNWDLLNDGLGSPKNTRSLLWSGRTPPVMSESVRPTMEEAVLAGFRFLLFREPDDRDVRDVAAYIRSMRPEKSPYLKGGKLSTLARRGRNLFNDPRVGCVKCHPAPLFTDLASYDVGTRMNKDGRDDFDTPTLVELWRTGPFLHHGKAVTLKDVLTKFNRQDRHGKTSHLSPKDIDALAEYLKSL